MSKNLGAPDAFLISAWYFLFLQFGSLGCYLFCKLVRLNDQCKITSLSVLRIPSSKWAFYLVYNLLLPYNGVIFNNFRYSVRFLDSYEMFSNTIDILSN